MSSERPPVEVRVQVPLSSVLLCFSDARSNTKHTCANYHKKWPMVNLQPPEESRLPSSLPFSHTALKIDENQNVCFMTERLDSLRKIIGFQICFKDWKIYISSKNGFVCVADLVKNWIKFIFNNTWNMNLNDSLSIKTISIISFKMWMSDTWTHFQSMINSYYCSKNIVSRWNISHRAEERRYLFLYINQ